MIVRGVEGVSIIRSSAPSEDISDELTTYPEDPLVSPPQDVSATFTFSLGEAVTALSKTEADASESSSADTSSTGGILANTPKDPFTKLISEKELTTGVFLFSLLVAFAFGDFHALAPGHGKIIVAAYLVGTKGTAWHALLLCIIVTVTHIIGVFSLGLVTLYASKFIFPRISIPGSALYRE